MLAMPDFDKPWEVVSDACGYATGAVAASGRQELLGCVEALRHWRPLSGGCAC